MGARRGTSQGDGTMAGRWRNVQQLTCCAQQLAIGVLSTMFGGVFHLSGGSSKAVQQSPPIKASSRGEEDFIQYVTNTTCAITHKTRIQKDEIWD